MARTAVASPAPRPSNDELLDAIDGLSLLEFVRVRAGLMEMGNVVIADAATWDRLIRQALATPPGFVTTYVLFEGEFWRVEP